VEGERGALLLQHTQRSHLVSFQPFPSPSCPFLPAFHLLSSPPPTPLTQPRFNIITYTNTNTNTTINTNININTNTNTNTMITNTNTNASPLGLRARTGPAGRRRRGSFEGN
jgi:hypothetical protein